MMSDLNKFTPGPWMIIPGGDEWNQGRIATIEPAPETMTEINYWTVAEVNPRRHECTANAYLIAAAPDLLEAIEMLILFSKPSKTNAVALHNAYQTIAKARGQS